MAHNHWSISPPGSTSNARHIFTNKVVSSFESFLANTPLGGMLADYMGLGKPIQAIAQIVTSKEWLITTPTLLNHQLEIRNIQVLSGWSTAIQNLPWPHLSLIIQGQHLEM
ncbi:hypothetical protein O181_039790 [Austropuccinia psidii MF-1]|uniref:SNF2 N-terminal domain-containing protein n=1 Tax=Austropuccinia psidii MF-1 TaxID=1389203 RepID=A0A9Q3DFI5_9BASI|nr:hypothetical protein [Austropuccinia psidii MF-1]